MGVDFTRHLRDSLYVGVAEVDEADARRFLGKPGFEVEGLPEPEEAPKRRRKKDESED